MKFSIIFFLILQLALFETGYARSNQVIRELDHVVAVVNNEVITYIEMKKRIENIVSQLKKQNTRMPPLDVITPQILERLIIEKIQLQLATRRGYKIDDETLNKVLANIAHKNKMDLITFRNTLEKDGISFSDFRENIREEMLITQLRQRTVETNIHVSNQEVELHLKNLAAQQPLNDEFRLGHILLSVPEAATPEQITKVRQKAEAILERLKQGEDFTQIAIANSDGQQALTGGDLGWRKAGQLPTLFSDIAVNMKSGDVSNIVRSPSGFHIIKLLDRRGTDKNHKVRQIKARHILIQPTPLQTETEIKQILSSLRSRIVEGEDFATLAKANSMDKGSASKGGELGWLNPGETVPAFEDELKKLKPGETSQPFESTFGWHIVQLLDKRVHNDTKEYQRLVAFKEIKQRKTEEALENWIRQLRDEAYVEYRLNK